MNEILDAVYGGMLIIGAMCMFLIWVGSIFVALSWASNEYEGRVKEGLGCLWLFAWVLAIISFAVWTFGHPGFLQ